MFDSKPSDCCRDHGKRGTYTRGNKKNDHFNNEEAQYFSYGYYEHIALDNKPDRNLMECVESRDPEFKAVKMSSDSVSTKKKDKFQKDEGTVSNLNTGNDTISFGTATLNAFILLQVDLHRHRRNAISAKWVQWLIMGSPILQSGCSVSKNGLEAKEFEYQI